MDVGFGSMQLSLFDKDSLVTTQNLPLGVMRIQRLTGQIPANMDLHRQMVEELVDNELFTFRKMYLKDRNIQNLIGIGDNSLVMLRQALNGVRPDADV